MYNGLCSLISLTVIYSAFINLNAHAYSQVYQSHGTPKNDSAPRIFKALNADLLIDAAKPNQKNENLPFYVTPIATNIENQTTTESTVNIVQPSSSGRAIYTQPLSNFGPLINSFQYRPPPAPTVIYSPRPFNSPQPSNLQSKEGISDRFSPSEAVASNMLRKKNKSQYQQNAAAAAAASNNVQSYVKPSDLYSFPPNTNSKYPLPPPHYTRGLLMGDTISSYLPPPSGPLNQYEPVYAASENKPSESDDNKEIGVLPASAMDQDPQNNKQNFPMNGNQDTYNKPPDDPMEAPPAPAMDDDASSYQAHIPMDNFPHPHDDDKEYPTPPPGWKEDEGIPDDHPPIFDDQYSAYHSHHHDHPHHIVYDDFPHYQSYHHHHELEALPPLNTPRPLPVSPPEPPPEPRVKKYSYFYIGRKLWYIPLYFTVWFSFYVLWLILKSIARHKVNLPNHYTARRSIRSDYASSETLSREVINKLTISVLNGIEQFTNNYVT